MEEKIGHKKSMNVIQLLFWSLVVIVVFTCNDYSFSKRDLQLDSDGFLLEAEIVKAFASTGSIRIKYRYISNGKTCKNSGEAPGHLRSCGNDKKCIGDSITILVSKSKPEISRIAE